VNQSDPLWTGTRLGQSAAALERHRVVAPAALSGRAPVAYAWNWLSLPYFVCAASLVAAAVAAALVRGDRVLRLGTIGAATTSLPWAVCSGVALWTADPVVATRLLRLGNGPIALVGPSLLLVLLGVSGQLERFRWTARIAGLVGLASLALCWSTDLVVAGVHAIPAGTLYISPGPLTTFHFTQMGMWLLIGMVIVRRSTSGGERRRLQRMLIGLLALGTISSTDLLLVYRIGGVFPIASLCTTVAALVAIRFELKTDLLRPQGFDHEVFVELIGFMVTTVIVAILAITMTDAAPVAVAGAGSLVWIASLAVTWSVARGKPAPIARERALEAMVAALGEVDGEPAIADQLAALWKQVAIDVRATYRVDGDTLVDVLTGDRRHLDRELAGWLVEHGELLAVGDLGTMRVGPIRPMLEQLVAAGGATLLVPLIDRDALVGLVEADHFAALREDERGLVGESARAAARAVTYVAMARAAAREGETAREVEVAEAMRLQASASRDDELGHWAVTAEYRTAARTTGAAWSASLLADGRLAVLVTEAQAHGVAAALATAALTGAFAAATRTGARLALDELLASLHASAQGVIRGGEPVAAFVAIIDARTQRLEWAAAGHPGATIVGPIAHHLMFPAGSGSGPRPKTHRLGGDGTGFEASLEVATRGDAAFPDDALLVIASMAVRGPDEARWQTSLSEQAPAGARLATVLVETALRGGAGSEDLLAVVVRRRVDRPSGPIVVG